MDLRPLIASLFISSALHPASGSEPNSATAVRVAHPLRGEITRYITLPASIHANQQATLYAKVPGYVTLVAVDKGDTVKEGDLLARIEEPEIAADVKRYQADAKVSRIKLERLSAAQKKAPDLVLPQELDDARAALDSANALIERNQTLLDYAAIKAPFTGVITMRYVDPGAFVPAATTSSTAQNAALFTLMDFNVVRLQTAVPEAEVPFIRAGLPVKMSLEEFPGRTFEGKVTRLFYALDESTRSMLVETDMPNPGWTLRPGMYAIAQIGVEKHANALLIPADTLVMEKAAAFVYKIVDGKARRVPVQAGFNDGTHVELITGVEPGDQVIAAGKVSLTDGQAVQPESEK